MIRKNDWKQGDPLTASHVNWLTQEVRRLGNIRAAQGSGLEVSNNASGITIRGYPQPSADRRLAIARKQDDGTWPSFQTWTECDGSATQQQTIFDFEFVEPSSLYDPDLDRPSYYFPYSTTGEFVRALNMTEHYVPHYLSYAGYVQWLTKVNGKWFAEYSLPPIIKIHLLGDLYPDNYALAHTTNYELGNPQFRVYDTGMIPATKKWSTGAVGHARLQRNYSQFITTPVWRYEVYEVIGCPTYQDAPEEE